MSRKLNVAVLMGGRTAEHDVSLDTGRMIVGALNRDQYNIKPVTITQEGNWLVPHGYIGLPDGSGRTPVSETDLVALNTGFALDRAIEEEVDVVFIALHGPYGEDGTVQGLLELADLPYTGSGVLASALAMNKPKSRQLFEHHGLTAPQYFVLTPWTWAREQTSILDAAKKLGFPCVIKPAELGSSVGISIVADDPAFLRGVEKALEYDDEILVEEYISGDEMTCAVLGSPPGEDPIPLVPTQIVPRAGVFFDYEAKYTPGATEEITPPRVEAHLITQLQETAVQAHQILGCEGLSRTDMILCGERIYVLETNTIPGMTENSLYPQAARAAGIEFSEVLDRIIKLAVQRHETKRVKVVRS